MGIDVSNPGAKQSVPIDEMSNLLIRRDRGLRKVQQGIQDEITLPQPS